MAAPLSSLPLRTTGAIDGFDTGALVTDVRVLRPQWPASAHVHALCTTRSGGHSEAPYNRFNLGTHVQDAPHLVQRNRALHQRIMGVSTHYLQQVHGVDVVELHAKPCSNQSRPAIAADAAITLQRQLACTVMVADCLPVLFTDVAGTAVAAAHAGWRGLAAGILERTAHTLARRTGSAPDTLLAWLGPCIGRSAFEVGADVYTAFVQQHATDCRAFSASNNTGTGNPKYYCDLALLARNRLHRIGIATCYGNDSSPAWCTYTQWQRCFSHRRDTARLGATGRMAASIWLL